MSERGNGEADVFGERTTTYSRNQLLRHAAGSKLPNTTRKLVKSMVDSLACASCYGSFHAAARMSNCSIASIRDAIVSEVSRLEDSVPETKGQKLRAADQVELCFCHSHSLAIADGLESLISEISEHLNAFGRLNASTKLKCNQVRNGYQEVVNEVGLERRPAVLLAWLERVQAWLNQFPQ